jgi:hypothetical protein
MNPDRLQLAQNFIWHNARLLERRMFLYHFAGGSTEGVLSALRAYQNTDGGFGDALEPDKRDPHSQPVDVEIAFHILDGLGIFPPEIVTPAVDWLLAITTAEGGVPFVLPSANRYPGAPWWRTDPNPPASLNPTATLTGLLLKYNYNHPWLERAVPFCWKGISGTKTTQYHDLMPILAFLQHASDHTRAATEIERICDRLRQSDVVAYDPATTGYAQFPLDWSPVPTHPLRSLFTDEVIQTHLKVLADRQQPDGGWPINWEPISAVVAAEWRGWGTVQALLTLQAYGYGEA